MKKNILLIITKLSDGGAERNVALLADRLSRDYNVFIAAYDNSKQDYNTKVEIIDLKTPKTKNIIKKFFKTIIRIKKIKQIKKSYKIDCSISFLTGPNIINALSKGQEKVIISIRNYISMYKHRIIFYIANKIACNRADKIVCVAESVKKDQIENYKIPEEKLITIYNACNIQKKETGFNEKYKSDIITIGRLNEQKGQWHLIKAFKKVVEKYPAARMIILGKGELKEYLNEIIIMYNLQDNVKIEGFVNNPQDYLANSKIFALTSVYEGLPNVILEAMVYDLPIIATDCFGGTKEILEPSMKCEEYISAPIEAKYGILVPNMGFERENHITQGEEQLANYLIQLLENKELRNKYIKKSKERVKFFNDEDNLRLWKAII